MAVLSTFESGTSLFSMHEGILRDVDEQGDALEDEYDIFRSTSSLSLISWYHLLSVAASLTKDASYTEKQDDGKALLSVSKVSADYLFEISSCW